MSKKWFLLLLIPALLIIGGYLYVRFSLKASIKTEAVTNDTAIPGTKKVGGKSVSPIDLRPLLIARLQQLLKKSSAGLYNLSIHDLRIDVLASTITLQGVTVQPDSAVLLTLKKEGRLPSDVFTVTFDSLQIDGVNIDDALNTNAMDYKLVKLVHPTLFIHHYHSAPKKTSDNDSTFAQRFLVEMEKLSIKKIVVEEGAVIIYKGAAKSNGQKLQHLSVVMNDVLIDSATRLDTHRFLFAKEATLSFKNYSQPTTNGLYTLSISSAMLKAPLGDVTLTDVSFTSPLNKAAFMQRQRHSTSLYHLRLAKVNIHSLQWWSLLNSEEFIAADVAANGGAASVYIDRSLPSVPTYNSFPSQLLMKLAVPVNLPKLTINNINFSYEEYNPFSRQSGTLFMDKAHLLITNLSNLKEANTAPLTITAKALFMHTVPLEAGFVFSKVQAATGTFTTRVKAAGFDARIVNSFAVPMGLVQVEDGVIDSITATINGNQSGAGSTLLLPYRHLKLSLMEKNKDKPGMNKKHITSTLANLLFVKNNNPSGSGAPRQATDAYNAPAGTPFFSMVWKGLLVGVLKTIGAPKKIAYETTEPPAKK